MRLGFLLKRAPENFVTWLRSTWPLIWKIGLGVVVCLVVIQLLYPRDRSLPFAVLGTERVGFVTESDLQSKVDHQFMGAKVTLTTPSKSTTVALNRLGAASQSAATAKQLTNYPLWERLVPTSIVWHHPAVHIFVTSFDKAGLNKAATTIATNLTTAPVDAGLAVKNNTLVFTPAKAGYTLSPEAVEASVRQHSFALKSSMVKPRATKAQPTYTDADFASVRAQAEKAIALPISFVSPQKETFTADKATIASWLTVKKESDHKVSLAVNGDTVNAYLAGIDKKIGSAPKPTQVQLRDGVETGRQPGAAGTALDNDDALKKITAIVDGAANRTIGVALKPVAPPLAYTRSYSSSQAGLQAYVNYITSAEDVHIALQQLDGNGWSASARASDSVVSASTYKLYVSMMLFTRIDGGQSSWSDQMQGTTARTCFDQMIVQSLNNCAEDWIKQFGGGAKINDFLYSKGISRATTFTASDATHTSANDLLKTLLGLQNGTLYTGSNRDILLGDMGRQVYRKGVPAGSSGSVQDKVGFLWDYNHDAAIVHTAKGSYAAAIMTKGQSFDEIATITRQLEAIMYP